MAESLVVSGLVSKRAEVAGQIASYQTQITRLQDALSHLDGSIKLFSPEYDLRTIQAKRTNKRNQYIADKDVMRLLDDDVEVFWSHDLPHFDQWLSKCI